VLGPAAGAERRRYAGQPYRCRIAGRLRDQRVARSSRAGGLDDLFAGLLSESGSTQIGRGGPLQEHLRKVIDAAAAGVELVGTFIGRDQSLPMEPAFAPVLEQWPPLVKFAADHGSGSRSRMSDDLLRRRWPVSQPRVLAALVAAPIRACRRHLGLNLDPSHLVWQLIEIPRRWRVRPPDLPRATQDWRSIATASTRPASCRSAWAGRYPECQVWARWHWNRFIAALIRPATTVRLGGAPRIVPSRVTSTWSNVASFSPEPPLRPLLVYPIQCLV